MLKKEWFSMALAAVSAFCVYTCMYAFRKPLTVTNYSDLKFLRIDYKVWLVIAQTVGYTLSKFYGVKFIGELKNRTRSTIILLFIAIAWTALLFFAITPAPFNIIFLLVNGFPLGIIYGLVFSYLEGRRATEMLGAVLASSFIFASGFTQSVAKYVLFDWKVDEWWMPFVTGALFLAPLVLFTLLLEKTPTPGKRDLIERTKRIPMNKTERRKFIQTFLPGLLLLILVYVLLTIIRDYRSNFASNIWSELGMGNDASVFVKSEIPASLITLVLLGMLVMVKNNFRALLINHFVIAFGFILSIVVTVLYVNGTLSPFWWITTTGVGLYMGYVPFNCMLFERLIASFKYVSNAGFLIYLADSFGYLGSDTVLITKNLSQLPISWTSFFIRMIFLFSAIGLVLVIASAFYFRNKYYYKHYSSTLSYV